MPRTATTFQRLWTWARPARESGRPWVFIGVAYAGAYALLVFLAGDSDTRWSLASRAAALAPGLAGGLVALSVWRLEKPRAVSEPDKRGGEGGEVFGAGTRG